MEVQKASNNKGNYQLKEQIIPQSYSNKNSKILAQKQTEIPM
jgi:dTDP-D-glucose 4,6-dehydratase